MPTPVDGVLLTRAGRAAWTERMPSLVLSDGSTFLAPGHLVQAHRAGGARVGWDQGLVR